MLKIFGITAMLIMAITPRASAQQYAARHTGDLVQLEDTKNKTVVSIKPSSGNLTTEMKVNGQDVLGAQGIPVLAPWANRLDEQAFWANGKRYPFDMALGNVNGAVPIHGFLQRTDQWQVVEVKQDGKSAWVTSRLDVYKQPMWMKQWPFAHTIEMTHRLKDGVLEVHTKITNMSAEPMPVAIGFHPYYQLTDSQRVDWTITVPARTRWLLNYQKLPTGETESTEQFFPNGQGQLKDFNLDDAFSDLTRDAQGLAHMFVKGKQQQLEIMFSPTFKSLVMYSPNPTNTGRGSQIPPPNPNPPAAQPARAAAPAGGAPAAGAQAGGRGAGRGGAPPNFVCFEPMAGITNAMNLAQKGLYKEQQYVAPNQTWEASFWVKPSGF